MRYTAKYFKKHTPEWKIKRFPLLGRFFYRPISYVLASILANLGISANTVSFFSAWVAVIACGMFLIQNSSAHIVGAILMIVWFLLDCVDGNLARGVKKQPFGEFADAISGYLLLGFMGVSIGFAVYFEGGLFIQPGNPWIILAGALASSSDTMIRLIYQKYKNTESKLAAQGIIDVEEDFMPAKDQPTTIKTIISNNLGIEAFVHIILITSVFKCLDIAVLYCFLYNSSAFILLLFNYITKAKRIAKNHSL